MAQFDESKVINALHPEKAEVGKEYWYSDSLINLKTHIELGQNYFTGTLLQIDEKNFDDNFCIKHSLPINDINITWCRYLYPYEEPPKLRMTKRQLSEWSAKGNGEFKSVGIYINVSTGYLYLNGEEDSEAELGIKIRHWDSEEWVEPTVDIYERDCKGKGKE